MQRICKDTHICHVILRGKSNLHLFQEEIQKVKILDAARKSKGDVPLQVLAYCVLDNEIQLLMLEQTEGEAEKFLMRVQDNYIQEAEPVVSNKKNGIFRKNVITELNGEKSVVRVCVKLHSLPVKYGIVKNPQDYWWCSYPDYMGRKWMELTDTAWMLQQYDSEAKKAVRLMRKDCRKYLEKQKDKLQ